MANNFSTANCITVWNFNDSGTPLNDVKGTNHLSNGPSYPTRTTSGPLEGAASMDYETGSTDVLYRNFSDLSDDYPLPAENWSIAIRFNLESAPGEGADRILYSQAQWDTNSLRSIVLGYITESGVTKLYFIICYNSGVDTYIVKHATGLSLSTHYEAIFSLQSGTNYAIRLRNSSGGVVGSDLTGSFANAVYNSGGPVVVGSIKSNSTTYAVSHDGYIDEIAVFNSILTSDEASNIAAGNYNIDLSIFASECVGSEGVFH